MKKNETMNTKEGRKQFRRLLKEFKENQKMDKVVLLAFHRTDGELAATFYSDWDTAHETYEILNVFSHYRLPKAIEKMSELDIRV